MAIIASLLGVAAAVLVCWLRPGQGKIKKSTSPAATAANVRGNCSVCGRITWGTSEAARLQCKNHK